jgi:flagellar assembly factor FliW
MLGEIEIAEDQVIEMTSGMIGFPDLRRYALIPFANPEVPFLWWQSVDDPTTCFLLIEPTLVCPGYEIKLPKEELEDIDLAEASQGWVHVVATVPDNPREMTVNLMGPVVGNRSVRKAKQLVLTDPRYTTKHRVLQQETPGHACANSQSE